MDIDKIESFVTLAEIKHFAKASEVLYISQPALSKRIQALEDELNVPLLIGLGRKYFLLFRGNILKNMQRKCWHLIIMQENI